MKKLSSKWIIPLLLIAAVAPWTSYLDLACADFFFTPALEAKGHFVDNAFTRFMYRYGEEAGFFIGCLSCVIFLLSFFLKSCKRWRKGALSLILTLVLGAGILVNGLLKEYWGRPRPKQVEQFGGPHAFRPFYRPNFFNQPEPMKSFPSGHATMGFYYCSLFLAGRRYHHKALTRIGLVLTIGMGGGLSLTRVAQGGHFFSDVLCAGCFMWITALFVDWMLFESHWVANVSLILKRQLRQD